jgi:DNA processing protein
MEAPMDAGSETKREEEALLRLALWMIPGISGRAIQRLLEREGGVGEPIDKVALADAMGLKAAGLRHLLAAPDDLLAWARGARERLSRRGALALLRGDPAYPDFGGLTDPPEVLFTRGDLGGAGAKHRGGGPAAVAVVGARKAHPAALIRAHRLGFALARAGWTVVSGGAFGVDASAHRGALEAEGHTVAVLGSGVLLPLPMRNRRLFADVLHGGGALASELPPEERPWPSSFPRRNRLIAGLARAVVVILAGEASGSLYTARAARALGRQVFVFPDQVAGNAGSRLLLQEGATAVSGDDELLALLEGEPPPPGTIPQGTSPVGTIPRNRGAPQQLELAVETGGPSGEERQILGLLAGPPSSVPELSLLSGLQPTVVAGILGGLCASGRVRPAGPGKFTLRRAPGGGARGARP